MPANRYSVEQIVAKLREHEKLQGQGVGYMYPVTDLQVACVSRRLPWLVPSGPARSLAPLTAKLTAKTADDCGRRRTLTDCGW